MRLLTPSTTEMSSNPLMGTIRFPYFALYPNADSPSSVSNKPPEELLSRTTAPSRTKRQAKK